MAFVPVKELALNQLIRVPAVRERARRGHQTGDQLNPVKTQTLFDRFTALLDRPLSELDVLELGPGRGTGMMELSLGADVQGYAAFDVEPYLSPSDLPDPRIDYRCDGTGAMPWPSASFDVVWCNSVLEHVRDPEKLQRSVFDVLRPGGVQISAIDFMDHGQDRKDYRVMYNMMKYSPRMWDAMTSHRSTWVNRLRFSEWRALIESVGFEIIEVVSRTDDHPLSAFRSLSYLDGVSDEDVLTRSATFVARRNG